MNSPGTGKEADPPRTGQRLRIGIVCKHTWEEEAASPFFTTMRENVERQARTLGMTVTRLFRPGEPLAHGDLFRLDGLVVIGAIDPRPVLEVCDASRNIVFLKNTVQQEIDIDVVQNDMAGATREGLELLSRLGHLSIGLITGNIYAPDIVTQRPSTSIDVRHQTYLEWMRDAGRLESGHVHLAPWTSEGGYRATVQAIRKGRLPTAFMIANDSFAIGALRAFSEAGIRVPEDVSVISFDNTRLAVSSSPPLSSFDLDPAEAGRQAVNLLLERIHGRRSPVRVTIPSRLVVRQSFTIPRSPTV